MMYFPEKYLSEKYPPEKYLPDPSKLESQSRLSGSLESVVMSHPAPKTYVARLQ
jgi:hypothetical protein